MAPLPPRPEPTIEAIYASYEADAGDGRRDHLGASLIGKECERALWYDFRWATRDRFPGRILRLFETGQLEEARLVRNLRRTGATVLEVDPDTGRQWRVEAHGGHFAGSLDAVALGLLEAPKTWHLVEFKTHNAKSFADLQRDGVRRSKPRHWAQMQVYMRLAGIERAIYVAVCKNTDELHTERVPIERDEADRLIAKAKRVIDAPRPPARISTDPTWWQCRYCEHHELCHEGGNAEILMPDLPPRDAGRGRVALRTLGPNARAGRTAGRLRAPSPRSRPRRRRGGRCRRRLGRIPNGRRRHLAQWRARGIAMMVLRPYQRAAIDAIYDYFTRKTGHPVIVIPTAGGKSLVMAAFIKEVLEQWPDQRILIVTHVRELISQNFAELMRTWPEAPAGIYSAGLGKRELGARILFAGIQSIHRKAYGVQQADLVLVDEAHLIPRTADTTYRRFLNDLAVINPHLKIIGFTATPYRLDSGLLHRGDDALFTDIAYEVSVRELIDDGFLVRSSANRPRRSST